MRERVAAWTGFHRDYIKPSIYPGGFAPNSHRSIHGKGGDGQCQGQGRTLTCFLVFSSDVRVRPRLRLITSCGLEAVHTTYTRKHISPAWTRFTWIQPHTRLFLKVLTYETGWCFRFHDLYWGFGTRFRYSKHSRITIKAFSGTFTYAGGTVFSFFSAHPCLVFSKSFFKSENRLRGQYFPFRLLSCYSLAVRVHQGMSSGQQTVISCCCYVP